MFSNGDSTGDDGGGAAGLGSGPRGGASSKKARRKRNYVMPHDQEGFTTAFEKHAELVAVPAKEALLSQRSQLIDMEDDGTLPTWLMILVDGMACKLCIAWKDVVVVNPLKPDMAWINAPCTNARVAVAIYNHQHSVSKKELKRLSRAKKPEPITRHNQSQAMLDSNSSMVEEMEKGLARIDVAIEKRVKTMWLIVQKAMTWATYDLLLKLLHDCGAFHDCPQDAEDGSMDSARASYSSAGTAREIMLSMFLATRHQWKRLRESENVFGFMTDGSGLANNISIDSMAYKLFNDDDCEAVLCFAGLQKMRRGTAAHGYAATSFQIEERDQKDMQAKLGGIGLDGCSANFGVHKGQVVRISEKAPRSTAASCANHGKQNATKHAYMGEKLYANSVIPTMTTAGHLASKSPKKNDMLAEAEQLVRLWLPSVRAAKAETAAAAAAAATARATARATAAATSTAAAAAAAAAATATATAAAAAAAATATATAAAAAAATAAAAAATATAAIATTAPTAAVAAAAAPVANVDDPIVTYTDEQREEAHQWNFDDAAKNAAPPAFTRWSSYSVEATKVDAPQKAATVIAQFNRAGEGGRQDFYLEDAGAQDHTAAGVAANLRKQEVLASILHMSDALPVLNSFGEELQQWTLGHPKYLTIVAAVITYLENCVKDPRKYMPNAFHWRDFVQTTGAILVNLKLPLKRTAGRTPDWIDRHLRRTSLALLEQHKEYLKDTKIAAAMFRIFNIVGVGVPDEQSSSEMVEAYYADVLATLVEHFCTNGKLGWSANEYRAQFSWMIGEYIPAARRVQKALVGKMNDVGEEKAAAANKKRKKGAPYVKYTRVYVAPLEDVIKHVGLMRTVFQPRPMMYDMVQHYLTLVLSTAPLESIFRYINQVVTAQSKSTLVKHLEMATAIHVNSPLGPGGKMAKLDQADFISLSVAIFKHLKVRRFDKYNTSAKELVDKNGQPIDITYVAGANYDEVEGYTAVDEDEAKNLPKQTVIVLEPPRLRARAADADADDADVAGMDDGQDEQVSDTTGTLDPDEVHMWVKCWEHAPSVDEDGGGSIDGQGGVMVLRAAFAEMGEMTPQKDDYLCVTGYDCKKWCTVKIVYVARGSVGDHRYRVEFDVDGSFDELQLLEKQYGLGLREEQWGKKEAKTRLGWMFLRPTTEAGGNILRDANSIFEAKGH